MLNIYVQLQNKGSYFPPSKRLSPNLAHMERKTALKIKIINIYSKNKQTKNKQTGKKKIRHIRAHSTATQKPTRN